MHWSFASVLLIIGALGIAIFYTIRFYRKKVKHLLDYSRLFLLIAFLLHYLFRIFHLVYGYLFTALAQLAFVVFLVLYLREVLFLKPDTPKDDEQHIVSKSRKSTLSYLLYGIAIVGILVGAQFKILHWQFNFITGNILLATGLLAAIASLFVESNGSKA